ncbi:hypothetical protein [Bacillus cereus group sp. BfR-BA-01700]|uniref:hypothetical protein n=1 Tax=Bacillus cereus group sp. BfR-BA-01700 TaxID=3094884 RepID=UPI0029C523C2|nr:hypothetical protein [Bacillus cereus group sp. BfR-BA-01700]MDX5841060.1 hypothetical protein [Bacillus cereus group sp. BfR-BA-01700]HDR7242574.1 hypothetical protein [Bacillus mobilis]
MTELELYKFCEGKEMDWRGDELYVWVYFHDLEDFTKMVGCNWFSEGGMEIRLFDNYVAIELVDLCDNYEIDPENILKKER